MLGLLRILSLSLSLTVGAMGRDISAFISTGCLSLYILTHYSWNFSVIVFICVFVVVVVILNDISR